MQEFDLESSIATGALSRTKRIIGDRIVKDVLTSARSKLAEIVWLAYATGKYMRHPFLAHAFEVEDVVGLVRYNYAGRVVFHAGDAELVPGIRLHLAGGYSAGLLFVSVHTARRWVVLASDVTHYYENMDSGRPLTTTFHIGDTLGRVRQAACGGAKRRTYRAWPRSFIRRLGRNSKASPCASIPRRSPPSDATICRAARRILKQP